MSRNKERSSYSLNDLSSAVTEVKSGSMSIYRASKTFGIPYQTLRDNVNGKVKRNQLGASTFFSREEEASIAQWIIERGQRGYPVSRDNIIEKATDMLRQKTGKADTKKVSREWFAGFCKRNGNISLRSVSKISKASAFVSVENLRTWHRMTTDELTKNDLMYIMENCPERIFNAAETHFQLSPSIKTRVLAGEGARNVYQIESDFDNVAVTMMYCISAAGVLVPPMMLHKSMSSERVAEVVERAPAEYGHQWNSSGYMTSDAMKQYLVWFRKNIRIDGCVALFVDGHRSHLGLEMEKHCKDLQIELVVLFPNARRILQPLYVGLFGEIKTRYKAAHDSWTQENPGQEFEVADVAPLVKMVNESVCTKEAIKISFRRCGLFPWDENNIDFSRTLEKHVQRNIEELPQIDEKLSNVPDVVQEPTSAQNEIAQLRQQIAELTSFILSLPTSVTSAAQPASTAVRKLFATHNRPQSLLNRHQHVEQQDMLEEVPEITYDCQEPIENIKDEIEIGEEEIVEMVFKEKVEIKGEVFEINDYYEEEEMKSTSH